MRIYFLSILLLLPSISLSLTLETALRNLSASFEILNDVLEQTKEEAPSRSQVEELAETMRTIIKNTFAPTQVIPRLDIRYTADDTARFAQALQQYRTLNPNPDDLKVFEYWQARIGLTEEWAKHENVTIAQMLKAEKTDPQELLKNYEDLLNIWKETEPTTQNQARYFTTVANSNGLKHFFTLRLDDLKREIKPAVSEQDKLNQLIEQIKAEVRKTQVSSKVLSNLGNQFGQILDTLEEKYGLSDEEKELYGYWSTYLILKKLYEDYKNMPRSVIVAKNRQKRTWKQIVEEYGQLLHEFSVMAPKNDTDASTLNTTLADANQAKDQFNKWLSAQRAAEAALTALVKLQNSFDKDGNYIGILIKGKRSAITESMYNDYVTALSAIETIQKTTPILTADELSFYKSLEPKIKQNIGKAPSSISIAEQEKLNQLIEQIKAELKKPQISATVLSNLGQQFGQTLDTIEEKYELSNEEKELYGYWSTYLILKKLYEDYKNMPRSVIVAKDRQKRTWKQIVEEYGQLLHEFSVMAPKNDTDASTLKTTLADANQTKDQFNKWLSAQRAAEAALIALVKLQNSFDKDGNYIGILIKGKRSAITESMYNDYVTALSAIETIQKTTPILTADELSFYKSLEPKIKQNIGKAP